MPGRRGVRRAGWRVGRGGREACHAATLPAPGTIIADVPWPQHRYDLAAVSQITDGTGVTVAVVDSGVDSTHPQLSAAVLAGADMLDRAGDGREDCVGHGTAVASVIAARPAPGAGLRGVAPGVTIVPVRVSERLEESEAPVAGNVADLATGIRAALAIRPKPAVLNLSIATTGDDPALRTAIESAIAADIVVVAAVGNQHERGDPAPYPASYDGVIGVGAIGPDGVRVPASQVGSYVDIVAPGDGVVGAVPAPGPPALSGDQLRHAVRRGHGRADPRPLAPAHAGRGGTAAAGDRRPRARGEAVTRLRIRRGQSDEGADRGPRPHGRDDTLVAGHRRGTSNHGGR